MKPHHERKRTRRVAEPVQVYLDRAERERLERLAARLEVTKSDVLRRGLEALESQLRRASPAVAAPPALPTFTGKGVLPGVDLDDSASLLDRMEGDGAAR